MILPLSHGYINFLISHRIFLLCNIAHIYKLLTLLMYKFIEKSELV